MAGVGTAAGVRAAGRAAAEGEARDERQAEAGDDLLAHVIAFSSLRRVGPEPRCEGWRARGG